jgi:phosphoribosylformimino-5-aminoimidazole carboxamide ribotide isomerase
MNQEKEKSAEKTIPPKSGGFVIPAIDIIEGKCVRLVQGDFSQKRIYNERPLEVAKQFEDAGLCRLHLVDLDGARTGAVRNWKVLEHIAGKTKLIIDFGGGIKTEKDVEIVLNSGAGLVTIGSLAVKDENLLADWVNRYGPTTFFLGADVREEKIAIHGWQENTEVGIFDFIKTWLDKKLNSIFCTDVSKDGLLAGPAIDLYQNILQRFPALKLIASGGVGNMDDILKLQETGCSGVIIGKAIYEGRLKIGELAKI